MSIVKALGNLCMSHEVQLFDPLDHFCSGPRDFSFVPVSGQYPLGHLL